MKGEWRFLEEFSYTEPVTVLDWDAANALGDALAAFDAPLRERLGAMLKRSNSTLSEIGGDPLGENWARFRPLRLRREEDWSDWLAWLFENSTSGRLAALVFERPSIASCRPQVEREPTFGPHRLDLRLQWSPTEVSTLEVKIGDQNFEKTAAAAAAHRKVHSRLQCDDWILVPPYDFDRCSVLGVTNIGWDFFARCLRHCMKLGDESLTWRVFARAFVGCIEQNLLRFPFIDGVNRVRNISALIQHLELTDVERTP